MIVDAHGHAFPDSLAERAIAALTAELVEDDVRAKLDGTIASLIGSMDRAGIDATVVASIATQPKQFGPILEWSKSLQGGRVIPLPSVHPDDPEAMARIGIIADAGFKGVKLHPYYQRFLLDEPRMWALYEVMQERGLVLLAHTGFDIAYPRDRICDPVRIAAVLDSFPRLKLIASHMGAWEDWDEVEALLIGRSVYLDTAFVYHWIGPERLRRLLMEHPAEYILFGTDSPWDDQAEVLRQIRELDLPAEREAALLGGNAARLFGL